MNVKFVDVVLQDAGEDRMKVTQALREISFKEPVVMELDLSTARRLVDNLPCVVVPNVNEETGTRIKALLEKVGALVELKPA